MFNVLKKIMLSPGYKIFIRPFLFHDKNCRDSYFEYLSWGKKRKAKNTSQWILFVHKIYMCLPPPRFYLLSESLGGVLSHINKSDVCFFIKFIGKKAERNFMENLKLWTLSHTLKWSLVWISISAWIIEKA